MRTSRKAWLLPKAAGFGHLTMNGKGTPTTAHIPFPLPYDDKTVEFHFVGSNLIARAIRGGAAPEKLMITGPQGYIFSD